MTLPSLSSLPSLPSNNTVFILRRLNRETAIMHPVPKDQPYHESLQQALKAVVAKDRINKLNLVGIDFTGVDISRVTFDRCDFSRAIISHDFINVNVFKNCDFTGVIFK